MKFKIGLGTSIFMHCTFSGTKIIEIGDNSTINENCRFRGDGIKIGNNCSVSPSCFFITGDHDMDNNMEGRQKPVVIEDYVWIGTEVMLLPGAYVSRGSVVAARACVTRSFYEPNLVLAGLPAKVIKVRKNPKFNYIAKYRRLFQ
jgi:maltose O-acetyltransferase